MNGKVKDGVNYWTMSPKHSKLPKVDDKSTKNNNLKL